MQAQSNWEKVPNVPGFYRKSRGDSTYSWRFRMPRERNWTTNNQGLGLDEAKQWRNRLLGSPQKRVLPSRQTLLEYVLEWIEASTTIGPSTRRRYLYVLEHNLKYLHHIKLTDVGPDHVRSAVTGMREAGLASATIRAALVPARAALTTATARGLVASNPFLSLERRDIPTGQRKRKRILEPNECALLISKAKGDLAAIIAIMIFGGLRISEAAGLWWGDIDFQENTIHVWKQLAVKAEDVTIEPGCCGLKGEGPSGDVKERRVEMSGVLRAILLELRGDRIHDPETFIFATRNSSGKVGKSSNSIGRRFKLHSDAMGFSNEPALTPHQCRHNFASALIASGADVGFVSDQLGHSSPIVTLVIYRSEFRAAREKGSGARAIDALYGKAMRG